VTIVSGGSFENPRGISFDPLSGSGNLWTEFYSPSGTLFEFTTAGAAVTSFGTYLQTHSFSDPWKVAVGPDGYLYVGDEGNNQVEVLTPNGAYVTAITGLSSPTNVAVNSAGTTLYIDEPTGLTATFLTYTISGSGNSKTFTPVANQFPTSGAYALDGSPFIALDSSGNLYSTAGGDNNVYKFASNGSGGTTFIAGTAGTRAYGLAFDASNNLFTTQFTTPPYIEIYTSSGSALVSIGNPAFTQLTDICVDGSDNIYVADYGNNKIFEIKK
jgi:hypothetical protein